jgi:phage-related protein
MDKQISVEFYNLPDGSEPAKEFLKSLDPKMKAKMLRTIELLETNGRDLRMPYSEFLDDGIFELRAKVSSNITRVLYFFYVGNRAILTNGFIKKTQKTPKEELAKAKKYKADFIQRHKESNND